MTMADDPLQPDLMHALRKLVRGLEVLFWALPAALVVCVAESVSLEWQSWGVVPLVLVMGLLWYGASRLKAFQPAESVWQSTVTITELLALALVGLAPFLHWFHHVPEIPTEYLTSGQKHISYCLVVFCSATIMFLLNLNHAIARLAAMLPDPVLRSHTRFLVITNFILFVPLLALMLLPQFSFAIFDVLVRNAPGLAEAAVNPFGVEAWLQSAALWLAALIVATTMAMLWKTKEVVLNGVFSLEPPTLAEGDAEVDEDFDPSLN